MALDILVDLTSSKDNRLLSRGISAEIKIVRITTLMQKLLCNFTYNVHIPGAGYEHIVEENYPFLKYFLAPLDSKPYLRVNDIESVKAMVLKISAGRISRVSCRR